MSVDRFPVEAGHIMLFARSVGDPNPVYHDEEHAKNRVALGLPPRPNGPTKEQLEERVRKQRERLVKWEEELRMAG